MHPLRLQFLYIFVSSLNSSIISTIVVRSLPKMSCLIRRYSSFFILGVDLIISLAQILYGSFCLVYMSMTNKELTLSQQNIYIPSLVLLLCGIVILFSIILGCCGLIREIPCCINIYSLLFLATAVIQIAMGIFASTTFTRNNQELHNQMRDDLNITYKRYNENSIMINHVQSLMHCCGKDSPIDMKWNTTISESCCSDNTPSCNLNSTTLYRTGCIKKVTDFVIDNNTIIGYSAIISGLMQVLASIFGFCVGCHIFKYGMI